MPQLESLKDAIAKALPELDVVIAWGRGLDALGATPLFITKPEDLDDMILGPSCVHNLATYLPGLRDRKVGIVVKGCDSRSVIELLQEGLADRDNLTVFGFACSGVVNVPRLRGAADRHPVQSMEHGSGQVRLQTDTGPVALPEAEALAAKCLTCTEPEALICDHFAGPHGTAERAAASGNPQGTLERLEAMDFESRFRFWEQEMSRCLRCYACRSACPLCVCQDHCAAQSRNPHWVTQEDTPREKLMFQAIHALHLAGRCTECGECERACPMDIPVLALKQALNREIHRLFDYRAGTDPQATPPLFHFKETEENIKERDW